MVPNLLVLLGASFIPFLLAFAWFHPKLFGGDTWTKVAGLTPEQAATPVKPLKAMLTIIFNFFLAFGIFGLSVHQAGIFSVVGGNADLLKTGVGAEFMAAYGQNHLTFGHGAFHGLIAAITFILPVLMYAVIFERKSAKYLWINWGYWILSLVLMGGVICQWGGQLA